MIKKYINNSKYTKGIYDRFFGIDTNLFKQELDKLTVELNLRYINRLPDNIDDIFNKINYIFERINFWDENSVSSENTEVDIILESFENQLSELKDILLEIDVEFEKN